MLRGEYPEAQNLLEQAIELEPASTGLRAQATRVLRVMGELERARTELEEAVRLRPYSPRANLELGLVDMAQDQREDAGGPVRRARLIRANADLGITLFVIEHNMRVIMNLAEHIYCLAHGEMLADGTPDEIRNDHRVIDAYLGAH